MWDLHLKYLMCFTLWFAKVSSLSSHEDLTTKNVVMWQLVQFLYLMCYCEKWFILNDVIWNILLTAMFRLYYKYNIRDKIHILVSYLNSLWCLDGINEKSTNTPLYIIQCILKALPGMYSCIKKILKKEYHRFEI